MKARYLIFCLLPFSAPLWAADGSLFCPKHYGYIQPGMTKNEVIAACGEPVSKQESNRPITEKVPMLQMFYNNMGTPQVQPSPVTPNSIYHGLYTNPISISGAQLQIEIVDNKVYNVLLNGSDTNAFSICSGTYIEKGDPVGKVYGACGSPELTNKTYVDAIIPSNKKPEIWIYQLDQYQPSVRMTFVDGKLHAIE